MHSTVKLILLACGLALAAPGAAFAGDEAIAAAVSHADRPEAEVTRDGGRKPADVMQFFGVKPGMTILDVGSSGGYYAELFSHTVGADGTVIAQIGERFWPRIKDTVEPRHQRLGNVTAFIGDSMDYDGADNSVDMIFIALIWHHMHYDEEAGETLPGHTVTFLENALRVLKPGGSLAIIEHQAPDGATRVDSAAWHRTPQDMTVADVTGAGFEFAGGSDALANADDDLANYWREHFEARDVSQRYVLKFTKPASE